jgi:hypothetical protein
VVRDSPCTPSVSVSVSDVWKSSFVQTGVDSFGHFPQCIDMSKTNKQFMGKIRRKLTRVIWLYGCACGYETCLNKADEARWELEMEIELHIEALERGEKV